MKKTIFTALLIFCVIFIAPSAFADSEWDTFIAKIDRQNRIKEAGASIVEELRSSAPQLGEAELWRNLWVGDSRERAAAGIALADRIFPNGDPSRWEEVSGFLPGQGLRPRQLAAIDGLFVAAEKLKDLPDGIWGSAYLLGRFGKSGMGKVKFIDDIPAEMRSVIDEVVTETGLAGDWSSKKIRGRMPITPVYGGYITRGAAESRDMQYIDGRGSLSSNGRYAWDRAGGYLYEIVEGRYINPIWLFP